jgi:rSAM/selenodomain-associated transferase 2
VRISVIIPTINESACVANAIQSCWVAGADEVIIADGGSSDDTTTIAAKLGCQVVISSPGRGVQQNRGAAQASGDLLLFLHADCTVDRDCLLQIRQSTLGINAPIFGGFQQTIPAQGRFYRGLEWGNRLRIARLGLIYGDQGLFLTKNLFEKTGGFPDIPLMEDVVISRRLAQHGRALILKGPLTISPRRWERHGPIRQTLRNWWFLTLFFLGKSPEALARQYRRHDVP